MLRAAWGCARKSGLLGLVGWGCAQPLFAAGLHVLPALPLEIQGFPGGPFQPSRTTYTLTNESAEPVSWTALRNVAWISAHPPRGVLAAGQGTNLQAWVNSRALELEPEFYQGTLLITNPTQMEALTLAVSLTVDWPGPAQVDLVSFPVTNQWHVTGDVLPGTTVVLQESVDLSSWTSLRTNEHVSGVWEEAVDLGLGRRFYRLHFPATNEVPVRLALTNRVVEQRDLPRLTGPFGGTYLLEASRPGVDWRAVSTNKLPESGSVIVTNTWGPDQSGWEYRATELGVFPVEPLHQVLIIGQSLAIGTAGYPVLSTNRSDRHFRFFNDGTNGTLLPLSESGLETIASGAGEHLRWTAPQHRLVFSNTGLGGAAYSSLKQGTPPYESGIVQFWGAPSAAAFVLLGCRPSAIFALHGEADHYRQQYGPEVGQWQQDYEDDIRNITGQDVSVPMFHSQVSSWTSPGLGSAQYTAGAFGVLDESESNPDKTIVVCPKYFLPYADGLHLTNSGYRWLGEYYAKAYRKVVVEAGTWTPLKPTEVTRSNTLVLVQFHVPVPPLVLDTNAVTNPGQFGFEYHDGSASPPAIVDIVCAGPTSVLLTLSHLPLGSDERLRYAFTGIPGAEAGPFTGPRGNLRDSDPESSPFGNTLYNWCVHFDKAVTVLSAGP